MNSKYRFIKPDGTTEVRFLPDHGMAITHAAKIGALDFTVVDAFGREGPMADLADRPDGRAFAETFDGLAIEGAEPGLQPWQYMAAFHQLSIVMFEQSRGEAPKFETSMTEMFDHAEVIANEADRLASVFNVPWTEALIKLARRTVITQGGVVWPMDEEMALDFGTSGTYTISGRIRFTTNAESESQARAFFADAYPGAVLTHVNKE